MNLENLSPVRDFSIARTNFVNILSDRTTPLTAGRLRRGLSAVEQTAGELPKIINVGEATLVDLAAQAEEEAIGRGFPAIATDMKLAQNTITDRFAIKRGEYPLVEIRTRLSEDGSPVSYLPVYQAPEGRKVFGRRTTQPIAQRFG